MSSVNAEKQPYLNKVKASLYVFYYYQGCLKCCDLPIVAFHIGEGRDFTCIILMFLSTWLHCRYLFFKVDFPSGIKLILFPCCLGCHFDKYAKSQALEK